MSDAKEIRVPDIGDFDTVPVIEILVGVGDRVRLEEPLLTLESDKATMDIPSPLTGVVREIAVAVGDRVSQGSLLLHLSPEPEGDGEQSPSTAPGPSSASEGAADDDPAALVNPPAPAPARENAPAAASPAPQAGGSDDDDGSRALESSAPVEVRIPDIGDFSDVPVIDVLVKAGDLVNLEDPLITLESDKAAMDIPSPLAGRVKEVAIGQGDRVDAGVLILTLDPQAPPAEESPSPVREEASSESSSDPRSEPSSKRDPEAQAARASSSTASSSTASSSTAAAAAPDPRAPRGSPTASLAPEPDDARVVSHATPAMRRFARELGVDLRAVKGTGRKGRIVREDINTFVKGALGAAASNAPASGALPALPEVDFAKFGEIETRPLARIKRISGPHLHRSWVNVPHVTSHEEADVTELEAFRQSIKEEAQSQGIRITLLAFVTRAVAKALVEFPNFNASLGPGGDTLVLKKYVHIGIAVDTPDGLMVPVLRNADRKGVYELAKEMADLGAKAREASLKPDEMRGGSFSISSLGGIGGTAFTPIINAPEAAILGISRTRTRPIWDGAAFRPRLMLPLDLSWDHRVVDGAEAARFLAFLSRSLSDMRRLLL